MDTTDFYVTRLISADTEQARTFEERVLKAPYLEDCSLKDPGYLEDCFPNDKVNANLYANDSGNSSELAANGDKADKTLIQKVLKAIKQVLKIFGLLPNKP